MNLWVTMFCVFLSAGLGSALITPAVRQLAWKLGVVDKPSARRVNKKPIPRMGGVAIFFGLAVAMLVRYGVEAILGHAEINLSTRYYLNVNFWIVCAAFVVIFLTGLLDDIFSLKPIQKLAGQVIAASIAAAGGLIIGNVVDPFSAYGFVDLGWLAYPATVIYLVAYANIINLIDGLDGLSAGISCIASTTMFVLSIWAGRFDAALLSAAIAGTTLGFLVHNSYPATIFMGDSGSLTLGFALGTISLLSVTRWAGLTTIIVPLVVAGIPIIDTFSAIVRRTRAHVSFATADRGHIHHRLMAHGYNQRQAVLLMYGWTALLCVGSLIMTQVNTMPRVAIFVMLLTMSAFFAKHLHLFEPVLLHHTDPKTGEDELITPKDPDFGEEIKQLHEEEHEHLEELIHRDHKKSE